MSEGHDPRKPIGYGNPPKRTQFKPGQKSANPRGRPKKRRSGLTELVETEFGRTHKVRGEDGRTQRLTGAEILIKQLKSAALKGDAKAQKMVLDLMKSSPAPRQILTDEELQARNAEDEQKRALAAQLVEQIERTGEIARVAFGTGVVERALDGELQVTALGRALSEFITRGGQETDVARRREEVQALLTLIEEEKLAFRNTPAGAVNKSAQNPT